MKKERNMQMEASAYLSSQLMHVNTQICESGNLDCIPILLVNDNHTEEIGAERKIISRRLPLDILDLGVCSPMEH